MMNYQEISQLVCPDHASVPVFSETLALARLAWVDEITDERTTLRFAREIHWVRTLETRVQMVKDRTVIKVFGSFCESRLGHSLGRALERAVHKSQALNLLRGESEGLRVEVVLRVSDVPTITPPEQYVQRHETQTQRLRIPALHWLRDDDALSAWLAATTQERLDQGLELPWLAMTRAMTDGVVWSSTEHAPMDDVATEAWMTQWGGVLAERQPCVPDDLAWSPDQASVN